MVKKTMIATIAMFAVSCNAFAAVPSLDGKGNLGYTWNHFTVEDSDWHGETKKFDSNGFYGSVKLDDKWSLNGEYLSFDGKQPPSIGTYSLDNTYYAVDAQYQLESDVAVLIGGAKFKRTYSQGADSGTLSNSGMYVGLAAKTDLANNLQGYASTRLGSGLSDWTLGVTYNMDANTALDVNYRYIDARKLSGPLTIDATAKGLGVGIVHKF